MRPIKFRGRTEHGEFVYAELGEIMKTPDPECLTFIPCEAYYVNKNSIAQLVGYDCDGHEVYEGDTIVSEYSGESIVQYGDNPEFVAVRKLKEKQQ